MSVSLNIKTFCLHICFRRSAGKQRYKCSQVDCRPSKGHSHFIDIARLITSHLGFKVPLHRLLGLLSELELGPRGALLSELAHLRCEVLVLHQVVSIPEKAASD